VTCKNAWRKLGWLETERYRGCGWPVARPYAIICVCWWRTLWTHAL